MSTEIGVLLNPTARKAPLDSTMLASSFYSQVDLRWLSPSLDLSDLVSKKILVVGGDRSVRSVVESMFKRGNIHPIGIIEGGTNNLTYRALVKSNQTMTLPEFINARDYEIRPTINPGMINNDLFIVGTGVGVLERKVGQVNELLRPRLPRAIRGPVAKLIALGSTMGFDPRQNVLDIVNLSPLLASKVVATFPDQKLDGDTLTHAWVQAESSYSALIKLALVSLFWSRGLKAPETLLQTEQLDAFCVQNKNQQVYIDGDTYSDDNPEFVLSRLGFSLPVVAIT